MCPTYQFFMQLLLRRTLLLLNVFSAIKKLNLQSIFFFVAENTNHTDHKILQKRFAKNFNYTCCELKKSSLLICSTRVRRNGSNIVILLFTPKIMQLLSKIHVRKCFLQVFCFNKIRLQEFFVLLRSWVESLVVKG